MSHILPINVEDLLLARGVESPRIEFKAAWNEGPTGAQVIQTISAFANDFQNLNGGYVIIGVSAANGVAELPPKGLAPESIEGIQRWIRGRCNTLDPIYQPVLSPELVQDRHLLIIWCPGSETRPHQAPDGVEKSASRRYFIRLGAETVEAKGDLLTQLIQLTAKVPFDDRRAANVPLEKLRESRVREFLADVRSSLLDERDSAEIYSRMFLSAKVNDHDVPRNIGLLFFADDPEEWFRGARIEVVQFAADSSGSVIEERSFRGPLHHQLRDSINYLRSFSTQHLEKLADRPEVKGWISYPLAAMEEALVNAVYHRSYEGEPEPTKVYLYPDRIEIISYPGPVPGIELAHLAPGGRVPPVPARNRRIGEFLKELRLAEGRGTGIPKVYRAMEDNGSPAPAFEFDQARTYFRAVLPAHPEYVAITALRDAAHLRAIGDPGQALQRLRRTFAEHRRSATLASALIDELARESELDEARRVYDEFSSENTSRDPRVIRAMSTAFLDAGKDAEARTLLDSLPHLLSYAEAIDAAILERRAGREPRAHRLFERAGDAVHSDIRALHEFAQSKLKLAASAGRDSQRDPYKRDANLRLLREAQTMLERVLQMDAPPTRRAWAWFHLASALNRLGAPKTEIREALKHAIGLLPAEERFRTELARVESNRRR